VKEKLGVIGITFLRCEPVYYQQELIYELRRNDVDHLKVTEKEILPPDDVGMLIAKGLSIAFTPKTLKRKCLLTLK
jgi:methylmalonyl-CoA mutase cobalamin-binding subunit